MLSITLEVSTCTHLDDVSQRISRKKRTKVLLSSPLLSSPLLFSLLFLHTVYQVIQYKMKTNLIPNYLVGVDAAPETEPVFGGKAVATSESVSKKV